MKYVIFCCFLLFSAPSLYAQTKTVPDPPKPGAKDTTTKQYFLVILVKGQMFGKSTDARSLKLLENEQSRYLKKLTDEGKILLSGPFSDDEFKKGIMVFNCPEAEAMRLLSRAPMMTAGWLGYEIHPWWTEKNCLFK